MTGKYKVLILGAGGYLGARLAASLDSDELEIHGTYNTRVPQTGEKGLENIRQHFGDLTRQSSWSELSKIKFDFVINLISLDHKASEVRPITEVEEININIIHKIFSFLDLNQCKCVVNLSTVQIYGAFQNEVLSEQHAPAPQNLYGLTHSFKEQMLEYYARRNGVKAINLRLSNVYGTPVVLHQAFLKLVLNDFCYNALKNKKIIILSDGTPFRDFIHIDDAISGIKHGTFQELKQGTYNLTSGTSRSIFKLASMVREASKKLFGLDVEIQMDNKVENFDYDRPVVQYDNASIVHSGFSLKYDSSGGIQAFLAELYPMITA